MRITALLVLLALLLPAAASAAPLPKKEYTGLKKTVSRSAKTAQWEQAGEAILALAKDDSKRAVDDLCKFAAKYGHAGVYRSVVVGLTSMSSDEAVTRLCEKVGSGKLPSKLAAVDACGRRDDPRSGAAIIASLKAKQPQVQRAALSGIKRRKMIEAIAPLIDKLTALEESDPDGLNTAVTREALQALTGTRMDRAEDWARFWQENKDGFRPRTGQDEPVKGASTQVRPTFFGTELISNRMVFVVDVSTSMDASDPLPDDDLAGRPRTGRAAIFRQAPRSDSRVRINRAKFQLSQAIDAMPPRAKFTIVAYSGFLQDGSSMGEGYNMGPDVPENGRLPEVIGGVRWLQVWKTRLQSGTPGNKKSAKQFTAGLKPNGSTFTLRALKIALTIPDVDTIVLLSDGAPTEIRGSSADALLTSRQILDDVAGLNRIKRIRIDTFGVGVQNEEDFGRFLRTLAEENNGNFTEVR